MNLLHNIQPNENDLELLSAYIDDQLADGEREALEARLKREPELQTALDELRGTVLVLREIAPLPLPRSFTLDPAVVAPRRISPWFGWLRMGATVASVLLVLTFAADVARLSSFQSSTPAAAPAPTAAFQSSAPVAPAVAPAATAAPAAAMVTVAPAPPAPAAAPAATTAPAALAATVAPAAEVAPIEEPVTALGAIDETVAPAAEPTAPALPQGDAAARSGDSPVPESSALDNAMEVQESVTEGALEYSATPVMGGKTPPSAIEGGSGSADVQPASSRLPLVRIVPIGSALLIVGLLVAMVVVRRRAL